METIVQYARLNDPIAYGDATMRDAAIERRGRQNVTIDGIPAEALDIAVEEPPAPDIDIKVARLRVLIRVSIAPDEDAQEKAASRLDNAAQDYSGTTPDLEIGSKETYSHIWDAYTVEGRDI